MFFRFLGKIFFYLFVVPRFAYYVKKIIVPTILSTLTERMEKAIEKHEMDQAKSRQDHPAGSRLR